MVSQKALQEWCRLTCVSYPGLEIRDLSASFRDGLVFCAIIHKHRPDLIDFTSLSKDNAYENNKLAFEVAETKLGIPALLDPKDMLSSKVPDCLGVVTYLSQYYFFFSRKTCPSPTKLWSSHVTASNNLTRSKTSDGLTRLKSLTDLETGEENRFFGARSRTVCHLCFKPVHLIQRRLVDGKIFHRSCFRCKVCCSSLLPESYTQGSDPGSLICSYHITASKSTCVNLNQQIASPNMEEASCYSLSGLAISGVPHYAKITESQDRPVSRTTETSGAVIQESSRANRDGTVKESENNGKAHQDSKETSELWSARATESRRPVPAPRRLLDSSVVPVPAARIRTSHTMSSCPSAGSSTSRSKSPPSSSHMIKQTTTSPKVNSSHPWMAIVHPGPWTQLPPAPPPVPPPRSKSVARIPKPWNKPKIPHPNPFEEEEEEEETPDKSESAAQTKSSTSAVPVENDEGQRSVIYSTVNKKKSVVPVIASEENKAKPQDKPDFSEVSAVAAGSSSETDLSDVTGAADGIYSTLRGAQSRILPRSVSVPAIGPDYSPSVSVSLTEGESPTSCQSKQACKENPFDRKPGMTKSKTVQDLSSSRGPAPGHGFPLIKRKVHTEQDASNEELEVQMRELNKCVEALEQRGLELERNLRDCRNDKEEDQMLMEWFSLVHERHALSRKDTELVYQIKELKLEDRQTDVEYELRCLLNKPESDWTQEDRGREQRLMDELVAIIEQRNQIVSSLEQDRQRERTEDFVLEGNMKDKDFQKEKLKELKKSKGKFKPKKVFKLLNHK
ncbi:MICAL-like protein 1 [Salarias fasciatus]|uniref:MICAL-like protein 1 n=1 Tax=Salarias fasciatus TaxID=181472 RepID=A0A672F1W1_SALFA|nr:MICAL-like protein 1 [Salarias fasciatus]